MSRVEAKIIGSAGASSRFQGTVSMAKQWYSVSVFSNFEMRVAEQIRAKAEQEELADQIEKVLVPTEHVTEFRRGKKVPKERRYMPGYVLVKMEMTDSSYHLVKSVQRVTGFLGPPGKPAPMGEDEVNAILKRAEKGAEQPKYLISFDVGEMVSVTDGPFDGFTAMVEEVDEDAARLKVSVTIFGRSTPVDLEYSQVSKTI